LNLFQKGIRNSSLLSLSSGYLYKHPEDMIAKTLMEEDFIHYLKNE